MKVRFSHHRTRFKIGSWGALFAQRHLANGGCGLAEDAEIGYLHLWGGGFLQRLQRLMISVRAF